MARELILKLGKKITDRVDVKLGMTKLDENSPEYYGLPASSPTRWRNLRSR